MEVGWNFPNNCGGERKGVSAPGIETFEDDIIKSLAREICQNSLDAVDVDKNKPVIVEFEKYEIKNTDIPGYDAYLRTINKALNYYEKYVKNSEKAMKFLNTAHNNIRKKHTSVLRISDYNTVGLAKPYEYSNEGWDALIKIEGGASKSGDKAGSFGIGKNAPFCTSDYRLVFYRTKNKQGEKASQGVSKFLSYPEDINDIQGTVTSGTGYYGNIDKNDPIGKIDQLEKLNTRNENGTDIFIYGFKDSEDWESNIATEIIENFIISIYRKQLEVRIKDKNINNENLEEHIIKYSSKLKQAKSYHKVLKNINKETKILERSFHGLGNLKLSILIDQKDKTLNRKVLVTRHSGMKLFDLDRISAVISFSAILEMQGLELNEYFREMEGPEHKKWEPNRHTNPKEAGDYIKEIRQWIKAEITELGKYTTEDEIEVQGLGENLQLDLAKEDYNKENRKETLSKKIDEINIIKTASDKERNKGLIFTLEGGENPIAKEEPGVLGHGDLPGIRYPKGKTPRKKRKKHIGQFDEKGEDRVIDYSKEGGKRKLQNLRIIRKEKGIYRMSFSVPDKIEKGHIVISAIGENGQAKAININKSKEIAGCAKAEAINNHILFSDMKDKQPVVLEFSIFDNRDYAMEVNIYEHSK